MAVIPVGYAQANLVFGGIAAPTGAEVTLGLDIGGFTGSPTDAAEEVRDSWVSNVMPDLGNNLILSVVRVKFGPITTGPSGEASSGAAGGDGTNGASPAVSYLARKHTDFGGRAGSGRFYIPGVTENAINVDGSLTSAKRTDLTDGITSFAAALVVANLDPVLLHGVGSPLVAPTPITSFTVDPFVATQRRRQRR